jgi:hypothetical protein
VSDEEKVATLKEAIMVRYHAPACTSDVCLHLYLTQVDGKFVTEYIRLKESLGIVAQAYFSGAYVGNHIRTLLKKCGKIFRALRKIASDDEERAKLNAILAPYYKRWTMLYELFKLTKAPRMLEPREIEHIAKLAPLYANELRASVKTEWRREAHGLKKGKRVHLPLKLHMLEAHVPRFARRWGSVGLFAEDAFESIHALMNKLRRSCASMRNKIAQDIAVLIKLSVAQSRSVAAKSQVLAASRKRVKRA